MKTLRSLAEIEQIRAFWESCGGHRDAQIDFYCLFVATHPEVLRPQVIAVYRRQNLVALLLGRLEQKSVGANVGYVRLPTPRLRLLNFPYGGRLGDPSEEIDRLLIDNIQIALHSSEADAAMLHYLRVGSALYRFARDLPSFWQRDHFPSVLVHRRMRLPGGPGLLWAQLSSKERNNHKRRKRRLDEQFGHAIRIDCVEQESDIGRLAEHAEHVAAAGYQRGLGVGFRDGDAMRQRLALEARQFRLRGFLLYIRERPCAYWITSCHADVLYSDFLGYDPEFASYGPGMYLVIEALERFCRTPSAQDARWLDFGMGEGEWKAILSDDAWREANLYIFGVNWRAGATNFIRAAAASLTRAAQAVLAKTRLSAWIKQHWRRHLLRQK